LLKAIKGLKVRLTQIERRKSNKRELFFKFVPIQQILLFEEVKAGFVLVTAFYTKQISFDFKTVTNNSTTRGH